MKSKTQKQNLLGAHFSIAKGLHKSLHEAATYGCNTLQIFTKNANAWKERIVAQEEIDQFKQVMSQTGIRKIASHTSYLINLAAVEKKKHDMACAALENEMVRCSQLSIPYVVLHPGAHMGEGMEAGIGKVVRSIDTVFEKIPDVNTRLLLETTAGQGSGIGHTFEQIARIVEKITQKDRIGVCLDTCHIFAAGYDIRAKSAYRKTIRAFDGIIGLENLYVIHLNDSRKGLGSRVDRHAHIGEGQIGIDAFGYLMNDKRFYSIPKIIETDKGKKGEDLDKVNLEKLRGLVKK